MRKVSETGDDSMFAYGAYAYTVRLRHYQQGT